MEKEFELNLTKREFNYQKYHAGYYNIHKMNRLQPPINVQLVGSRPVNKMIHGSQNGNEVDAIGYYHFRLTSETKPDCLIFVLQHLRNDSTEYMIIPTEILRERLKKNINEPPRSRADEVSKQNISSSRSKASGN